MSLNPLDKSGFTLAVSVLWGKITEKFSALSKVAYSGKYIDLTGIPTIPTKTSQLQNDSGFKTTDTVYTHPTTAGNNHIPAGGAAGQFLKWLRDGVAEWASLGAAAFASLANNLATTEPGFAMDARVGPVIDKKFTDMETQLEELNSALGNADKISDLLPLFKLEGKTQKVTTTANAWKTVQFTDFTIPTGYRTIVTSFNASNAGVVTNNLGSVLYFAILLCISSNVVPVLVDKLVPSMSAENDALPVFNTYT